MSLQKIRMAQLVKFGGVSAQRAANTGAILGRSNPLKYIYWVYNKCMDLEFDPVKRMQTLQARGLDFARSLEVFEGMHFTGQDKRMEYQEDRFITVGWLDASVIVMVGTPRGQVRRIISMRKANDREKALYASYLEWPR